MFENISLEKWISKEKEEKKVEIKDTVTRILEHEKKEEVVSEMLDIIEKSNMISGKMLTLLREGKVRTGDLVDALHEIYRLTGNFLSKIRGELNEWKW